MAGGKFRGGVVACDECTKNCITIHYLEQGGPSSTVSRFFKIMLGRNWSDVLYLPPKFARDVRCLLGQKAWIEDSNGQKWTVEFSLVDGALAFQEGWHKFVEDHQLEHGEVLVFNYTKHGHFVVQIYGLSACEIMDFNRGRKLPKKRFRSRQETVFQDESHQIRNMRFNPTSKNMEDPSCMLSRDSGKYEVEDREFLFDLSNFEMGKNSSVVENSDTSLDRIVAAVETQFREQSEVMRNDTQMLKQLTDHKNSHLCGIATDAFQTKLSENSNSNKDTPEDVSKFQAGETENNRLHGFSSDALQTKPPGNSDSMKGIQDSIQFRTCGTNNYQSRGIFGEAFLAKPSSNSDYGKDMFDEISKFLARETSVYPPVVARDMKSPYICSSLLADSNHSINSKHCDASVTSSMHKDPFGKSATAVKKEAVKLGEDGYGFFRISDDGKKISTLGMKCGQISSSIIKTEPDMDNDLDPAGASSPFSAEVKSLAFLELPLCAPSFHGIRDKRLGKFVYLKDSTTRLWPVLYPDKPRVRVFTDGWGTFCEGNSIRTGDACRFQVEKIMPSCVLKVDIIRKAGRSSKW
ncbi:uncharacterized protein [Henckelia pumila]|uniref:uncharacterized protein isoform X2 n=1 Tax=Henckelia pumila TaxID=405737 RepID=UPI003C6EA087